MKEHSITFIGAKEIALVEFVSFSKYYSWDSLGQSYLALSLCCYILVNTSNWFWWKALLPSNILCRMLALVVFPHCISLWSQGSVSASSHDQSFVGIDAPSFWQLHSLCRIISLKQVVVIGWIFKLFWQKELLPTWSERWKWIPHCAEMWTPWRFLHSPVKLVPSWSEL